MLFLFMSSAFVSCTEVPLTDSIEETATGDDDDDELLEPEE